MANINNIIQEINTNFPDNNAQRITAQKLRDTLIDELYETTEIYDVSANNNGTKYADIAAAIGAVGANIPDDVRKGGMTIRFINSSTDKYEQWLYIGTSTSDTDISNTSNWKSFEKEINKLEPGIMPVVYYNGKIEYDNVNRTITFIPFNYGGIYIWTTQRGGSIFINIGESQTFDLSSINTCAICCNLLTNSLEVVYYQNLSSQYIPLICYDISINSIEEIGLLGGILPTSLMYDYIVSKEIIKLKEEDNIKPINLITKYSTYNYPFGQSQFNINYTEGKIEWNAGNFMIYTNDGRTLENSLSAGYSNFVDNTSISPKTYVRYIYFNRTVRNFDCVEYSKKSNYLSEHINDDLYLIACGTFDNPEQTMNAGGTFSIDEVVYGNYVSLNESNKLIGKKISILGDSISTFQGYLASDATGYDGASYAYWYPRGNVQSVEDTWWKKLINETGMVLLNNCAWSDSEVEGNSEATTTALAGCSDRRIADLAKNGTTPDIVICYIGVNDWGHDKPLGTFDENSTVPNEGIISNFADAYMIMVDKIQRTYPLARVFCCTLLNCGYTGYDVSGPGVYPAINVNDVALNSFNNTIINIANCLGAEIIDIRKCGFTFHNFTQYTIGDKLHPNLAGMELLKNFIRNQLELLY